MVCASKVGLAEGSVFWQMRTPPDQLQDREKMVALRHDPGRTLGRSAFKRRPARPTSGCVRIARRLLGVQNAKLVWSIRAFHGGDVVRCRACLCQSVAAAARCLIRGDPD